ESVYLRAIEETDAATSYEWMSDPEVRVHLGRRHIPNTEAQSRAFIARVDWKSDHVFAIISRADGLHVGNCGLHDITPVDRRAALGIVIGRKDQQNRGFGTESVRLLCRHAFENLNCRKVWLAVYATNPRGLKVYERCGFRVEGRLREHRWVEGKWVDEIRMGLLAGELRSGESPPPSEEARVVNAVTKIT
ncbi:MAG: GNAT family N-acetyltransferase, partial [Polyangiaceae bacterium]